MKKLLFLIVLLALGYGLWRWTKPAGTPPPDATATTVGAGFNPDASNATFLFDEGTVTLANGTGTSNDQGDTIETKLLDEKAYGDLNGDGKTDAVVLLAQEGGGSGVFVYVAAFVSGPVGSKGTNAVFIGDRIAPQSISVLNGVATVKYLDRRPDEAFAAEPTVPTQKQFVYRNGEFIEK